MIFMILIFLLVIFLISIAVFKSFFQKENIHDLLFLVLTNILFIISTLLFTFYFHEKLISWGSSFFLLGYSFLLILSLKKENKFFYLWTLPYFLFTLCLFGYLFFILFI